MAALSLAEMLEAGTPHFPAYGPFGPAATAGLEAYLGAIPATRTGPARPGPAGRGDAALDVSLALALQAYAERRVSLVGAIHLAGTSMTQFLAVARQCGVLGCYDGRPA